MSGGWRRPRFRRGSAGWASRGKPTYFRTASMQQTNGRYHGPSRLLELGLADCLCSGCGRITCWRFSRPGLARRSGHENVVATRVFRRIYFDSLRRLLPADRAAGSGVFLAGLWGGCVNSRRQLPRTHMRACQDIHLTRWQEQKGGTTRHSLSVVCLREQRLANSDCCICTTYHNRSARVIHTHTHTNTACDS